MLKHILAGMAASVLTMPLGAVPVELTLDSGGGFEVTYSLSTGQVTSGRDDLSGNILADLQLNGQGQVTRFVMTGGRVEHEDETLDLLIGSTPFGETRAIFITQGVASLPASGEAAGFVDPLSGLISNADHRLISNEGTAITRYAIGGSMSYLTVVEQERDLAVNPDQTSLTGSTVLTATEVQSGGWWKRVRIDLTHERDVTRTFPVGTNPLVPEGTNYSVRENGSFTASGEGDFPGDDFANWAATYRNITPTGLADLDPATGQPLLVMYALGAGAGGWSLPLVVEPDQPRAVMELRSATKAPVKWEFSHDLSAGGWSPLPGGLIPQGSTGDQVLELPSGGRIFLRAHVPAP
jgi:hypothetical protein